MKRQQVLDLEVDPFLLGQQSELIGNKLKEVFMVVLYILHDRDLIEIEGEQFMKVVFGAVVVNPPLKHL